MKIRLGFVTNSSSSSFILKRIGGKPGCIDEVYQEMLNLYSSALSKVTEMVEFGVQWGIIQAGQTAKDLYNRFLDEIYKPNMSSKFKTFEDAFVRKFDTSILDIDLSRFDLGWMQCKTYTEYLAYFEKLSDAPFIIIDHGDVKNNELHFVTEAVYWYDYETSGKILAGITKDSEARVTSEIAKRLGDFGIYSECGKIPQIVVNDLYDLAEYGCNHMG